MVSGPLKLNVGGGDKLGEERGYLNIDLRMLPKTDIGATASHLPFPTNTVDSIIASDCLEHVPRQDVAAAVLEWHRVLKPGGILKIKTPDLRALAQAYLGGQIGVDEFSRRVYGNQEAGDLANSHRSGQDPESLAKLLRFIGFKLEGEVRLLDGSDRYNMGVRGRK